jgi:peroxiredoxin
MIHLLRIALAALALSYVPSAAGELKAWTGAPPPSFELKDITGRTHKLADYRGKVVLVNFWATWCEPCRAEMPSLQRLREKLGPAGFVVLAVNADEPEARIRKFLGETPLEFPVLLDPELKVTRSWNARVLPASFVVAPDGRVRYHVIGEVAWTGDEVVKRIAALLPRP